MCHVFFCFVAFKKNLSLYFSLSLSVVFLFPGWPRMKWVVTDTKYLTKPSKDWQPHIPTANTDTAYIEVRLTAALQLWAFASFFLLLFCFVLFDLFF